MASRKKTGRRRARSDSAAITAQPQRTPVATGTGEAIRSASRGRLVIAVSIFIVWGVSLASLAVLTANPTTLNRAQIEQADLIVSGHIIDVQQGTVEVKQTWKSAVELEQITVRNLADTKAAGGSLFLLPLSSMPNGVYEIAQPRLPGQRGKRPAADQPRRIYPVTDDVLTQLQAILKR